MATEEKSIAYDDDVKKANWSPSGEVHHSSPMEDNTEKSEEEKEYLRKLNWIVLPFAGMTIFLNVSFFFIFVCLLCH